jgi:C4-type Zn-finger protein
MGQRLTLTVATDDDLKRTVLRSDTCTLSIPAAEIEVCDQEGAFTSVEGLLDSIRTAFAFMYLAADTSTHSKESSDTARGGLLTFFFFFLRSIIIILTFIDK